MRYDWLRDKGTHKMIKVYQDKGVNNRADPYTKHHLTKYHLDFRVKYNNIICDILSNY